MTWELKQRHLSSVTAKSIMKIDCIKSKYQENGWRVGGRQWREARLWKKGGWQARGAGFGRECWNFSGCREKGESLIREWNLPIALELEAPGTQVGWEVWAEAPSMSELSRNGNWACRAPLPQAYSQVGATSPAGQRWRDDRSSETGSPPNIVKVKRGEGVRHRQNADGQLIYLKLTSGSSPLRENDQSRFQVISTKAQFIKSKAAISRRDPYHYM